MKVSQVLKKRYGWEDPEAQEALEEERLNVRIAEMIYNYRKEAGLTQLQLAERVGTTQSVISRLEDADYKGHSLQMLSRIARALNHRLQVNLIPLKEKVLQKVK